MLPYSRSLTVRFVLRQVPEIIQHYLWSVSIVHNVVKQKWTYMAVIRKIGEIHATWHCDHHFETLIKCSWINIIPESYQDLNWTCRPFLFYNIYLSFCWPSKDTLLTSRFISRNPLIFKLGFHNSLLVCGVRATTTPLFPAIPSSFLPRPNRLSFHLTSIVQVIDMVWSKSLTLVIS